MRNLVAACVILVSASAVWAQLGEYFYFYLSGMIRESPEIKPIYQRMWLEKLLKADDILLQALLFLPKNWYKQSDIYFN